MNAYLNKVYTMEKFHIKKLVPEEWELLQKIRIEMVRNNPECFLESEESARARSKEEWIKRLSDQVNRIFGFFKNDQIIGLIGIFSHDQLPDKILEIGMSYTTPEYRKKGLTTLGYRYCLDYAESLTGFSAVQVSHRQGNEASRAAIMRAGFQFLKLTHKSFGDGKEDISNIYIYHLQDKENE